MRLNIYPVSVGLNSFSKEYNLAVDSNQPQEVGLAFQFLGSKFEKNMKSLGGKTRSVTPGDCLSHLVPFALRG